MLHRGRVDLKGFTQQPRDKALGGYPQHTVGLRLIQIGAVMLDVRDTRAASEQIHEEILRFDRIIGAMNLSALVVLGEEIVFDGIFREHGFGWLVDSGLSVFFLIQVCHSHQQGTAYRLAMAPPILLIERKAFSLAGRRVKIASFKRTDVPSASAQHDSLGGRFRKMRRASTFEPA